jgi:RHS repeat-associated protein
MTSGTTTIAARYDYDPYGRRTTVSGSNDAAFGFTGHFNHALSDLTLAPYRSYQSATGRWLSEDPLGSRADSLYKYVNNDPARFVDPDGRQLRHYLDELNPLNLSGSVAQSGLSMGDAAWGLLTWDLDRVAAAYDYGPLGQTQNMSGLAYAAPRICLVGAAVADAGALGIMAGPPLGEALGPNGPIFGTRYGGNNPWFNANDYLRIGWSYIKSTGEYTFRIGGKLVELIKSNPHINLWPPSWWFK